MFECILETPFVPIGILTYKIIKAEVPKNIIDKLSGLDRIVVDSGVDSILIETKYLKYISHAELVLDNSKKIPKKGR